MNAPQFVTIDGVLLHIEQVEEGEEVEYHTRYRHRKMTARIGREWKVSLAWIDTAAATARPGEFLGRITYDMITRETRSKGRRYVNARWQSPGWRVTRGPGRGVEGLSRKDCLERLVHSHKQDLKEEADRAKRRRP